jgi:hypothetical protein
MNEKAKILKALERLIEQYPEWRFGQMVSNVSTWAVGPVPEAAWDVTDAALLEAHLNSKRADC